MVKKKRNIFGYLILLLVVLLVPISGGYPVTAQATTLSLSPVTGTALTCTDTLIAVRVENVTGLYSYDVWLEFTPGSIEVWEVTNGSFLTFGYYNLPVAINNETGSIHITMTQRNPAVPKSGSGDLVYIRLRALVPGATFEIKFDDDLMTHPTELFTLLGDPISFTKINGTYTTADCEPSDLLVTPSPITLCVGYPYEIYVRVNDALDLYGYDLDLTFTPGPITITGVENAGYLIEGIVLESGFDNTLGTINYVMTQSVSSTNPPRDGSGNLIKIALTATLPDQTVAMNIENTSMLSSWSDHYLTDEIEYIAYAGTIYTAICDPTAVIFGGIDAQLVPLPTSVKVTWDTLSEIDMLGFNLYRAETLLGSRQKLNDMLIPAMYHNIFGGEYSYVDETVISGRTYYYWVEAVMSNKSEELGPEEVFVGSRIFLPFLIKN